MVFLGAYVRPEVRRQLERWAIEEDRSMSNLVTRLIRDDLVKSGDYPSTHPEKEPEPPRWPEIRIAPPVRMTIL